MRRIYVWRDGKLVEVASARQRQNLSTVDREEMIRRDSCYVMDDLRQDYQRISDKAEAEYNKAQQGVQ